MSLRNLLREAIWIGGLSAAFALALYWYKAPRPVKTLGPNAEFTVKGLDLGSQPRQIVIATSSSCPYCRASAEFHKTLVETAHSAGMPVVALVDGPGELPLQLSAELGAADRARKTSLARSGIPGTPTVLLLEHGVVRGMWVGLLNKSQEAGLLGRLGGRGRAESGSHTITEFPGSAPRLVQGSQFASELSLVAVIDVGPRDEFARQHLPGAINIPLDELHIRAEIEIVDHDMPIALDCSGLDSGVCELGAKVLAGARYSKLELIDNGAIGASCLRTPLKL